jgi:hypothetical protein
MYYSRSRLYNRQYKDNDNSKNKDMGNNKTRQDKGNDNNIDKVNGKTRADQNLFYLNYIIEV